MIKKLIKLLRGSLVLVILSFLCAAASVTAALFLPKLTGHAIDYIIGPKNVDFGTVTATLLRALVIILVTAVFQWIMNVLNNRIVYKLVQDVRVRAFNKIHSLPLSYLDSHRSGETLNRIIADTDQLSEGLLLGFTQAFTGVITILLTLVFMATISIKITLLVILITPLSLFIASFIGNIIPIYFIVKYIRPLFDFFGRWKIFRIIIDWATEKATKKIETDGKLQNFVSFGLFCFVAVPLPTTGAWVGSLIANFLNLPLKKAFIPLALGVFTAGVIVLLVTGGVITAIA